MLLSLPSAIEIIVRTCVVYILILLGLRLSGKRELGQMTLFDLVLLLLIANAVQNAMVGPDTSLTGGLLAAIVLLVLNKFFARLRTHSSKLRHLLEGSPTILIAHGKPITEHLKREGLDEEMLETALREHGISDLKDVELAVLEIDGSISIVPLQATTHRIKHPLKFLRRQS